MSADNDDEPERRDWLAEAREATGRSQAQFAHDLEVDPKTVSLWERGLTVPRPMLRPKLAEALGMTPNELNRKLGAVAPDPASLNGNGATPFERTTEWLSWLVRAEQSARAIWTLVAWALPALCQTANYARAVELSGHRDVMPDEVDALVATRTARAAALDTLEHYTALIPVYLIEACKGDYQVTADQFAHLVEMADRPNATLLLIDPEHLTVAPGEFTLLATIGPTADTVAESTFDGPVHSHRLDAVSDRVAAFDYLCSLALGANESRAAIAKSADRYAALAKTHTTKGISA